MVLFNLCERVTISPELGLVHPFKVPVSLDNVGDKVARNTRLGFVLSSAQVLVPEC